MAKRVQRSQEGEDRECRDEDDDCRPDVEHQGGNDQDEEGEEGRDQDRHLQCAPSGLHDLAGHHLLQMSLAVA